MHRGDVAPVRRPRRSGVAGVAALEFALIAPLMITLFFGTLDVCRAYITWQEVNYAAEAVAQAAEKLSVTTDPVTGKPLTTLTALQMQAAMSSIYAAMPGLNYGHDGGNLVGPYAVALSEVIYTPYCSSTAPGCARQNPQTLWSSYLTEGATARLNGAPLNADLLRKCGMLIASPTVANDDTQLEKMPTPTITPNPQGPGATMTLVPEVVADVRYEFLPTSPVFRIIVPQILFRATAALPSPLGDTEQPITVAGAGAPGSLVSCTPVGT